MQSFQEGVEDTNACKAKATELCAGSSLTLKEGKEGLSDEDICGWMCGYYKAKAVLGCPQDSQGDACSGTDDVEKLACKEFYEAICTGDIQTQITDKCSDNGKAITKGTWGKTDTPSTPSTPTSSSSSTSGGGDGGGGGGCFAVDALVEAQGKGPIEVSQVAAGDRITAVSQDGSLVYSRVVFTHEHASAMVTVKVSAGGDTMELTKTHLVPVFTELCGASYCAAATLVQAQHVKVDDRLYVSDAGHSRVATVTAIAYGETQVKYIVTEAGNLVVNGVVASVFSTLAKHMETLPFYVLDFIFPGIFEWAPVKAALYSVIESPAKRNFEQWAPVKAALYESHALSGADRLADRLASFNPPAMPQPRVAMGLMPASV